MKFLYSNDDTATAMDEFMQRDVLICSVARMSKRNHRVSAMAQVRIGNTENKQQI